MRVIRAFVDRPLAVGATVDLPEDAAAHLVRVLRLREGDACVLFNGDGVDHDARLVAAGKRGATAEIVATRAVDLESPLHITLVQGIARGEKMDWILQKATELGVARILPACSERSEVRLDAQRAEKRLAQTMRAGFVPYAMLFRGEDGKYCSEWRRFQREWCRPIITGKKFNEFWKETT